MDKKMFVIALFSVFLTYGQGETKAENSEKSSRESHLEALPYYNFGKGVGITSPDSLFQVNLRLRMQNRLEATFDEQDTQYKASIRRLNLRFDGYVKDPKFTYLIQLAFAPESVGKTKESSSPNIVRDAVVFYKATDKFSVGFGQAKLPGNRQRINSSGSLELTDRSINNTMFNIDRDFGFQAIYSNQKNNEFGYNIKTAISTGNGRNFVEKTDGLAYTGRLELYPLGKFKKGGEYFEGDLMREEKPKLYFGGTYHFNHKANKTQGQQGDVLFENRDLSSIFLDAMLKYRGWAAMLAYMNRSADNPITYNADKSSNAFVRVGQGYDAQLSYVFPSKWELIGRFSHNNPHQDIKSFLPEQNQLSFGVTKYIWEHAFKAQFEVTKNNFKYFDGRKDDNWYVRFQVEIGI